MNNDNENLSHPDDPGDNPIAQALELQDSQALLHLWSQSTELQEEIAAQLSVIENESSAQDLFSKLSGRYESASPEERQNIIIAMDNLGARNPSTEVSTTNFLSQQFSDREFVAEIIEGLKNKVMRATSSKDSEEIQQLLPIVSTSGKLFLQIIEGDYPQELQLQAMAGIYYCVSDPALAGRIKKDLESDVSADNQEKSLFALGELVMIDDANPDAIVEGLKNILESNWLENATDEEIKKFILIVGLSGDFQLKPLLTDLKSRSEINNNQDFQKDIEWALKKLAEKEQSEK